jgi:predicted kinase
MKNIKETFVMMLIGPVLSGKSTYIERNYPNTDVISRDEIVMQLFGSRDYNKAFKEVNQKEVDRLLSLKLKESNESKRNVIIDMTNMTSKRRKITLSYYDDSFYKIAIVFPILSEEEYERRNINRNSKENKFIPPTVIKSMIDSYEEPTLEEGFNIIKKL